MGNSYNDDHFMYMFLDNFIQGGKYTAQIASHQVELRREEKITYQKYLSISSLQTEYLDLDSSSGRNNEIENRVKVKCTFYGGSHPTDKC